MVDDFSHSFVLLEDSFPGTSYNQKIWHVDPSIAAPTITGSLAKFIYSGAVVELLSNQTFVPPFILTWRQKIKTFGSSATGMQVALFGTLFGGIYVNFGTSAAYLNQLSDAGDNPPNPISWTEDTANYHVFGLIVRKDEMILYRDDELLGHVANAPSSIVGNAYQLAIFDQDVSANEVDVDWIRLEVDSPGTLFVEGNVLSNLTVLPKAEGKTTIRRYAGAAGGTTQLYTVTAGKTFYLVGIWMSAYLVAAGVTGYGTVDADVGGNGVFTHLTMAPLSALAGAVTMPSIGVNLSPSAPMPFTAGTVFQVFSSNANFGANGGLIGWEE